MAVEISTLITEPPQSRTELEDGILGHRLSATNSDSTIKIASIACLDLFHPSLRGTLVTFNISNRSQYKSSNLFTSLSWGYPDVHVTTWVSIEQWTATHGIRNDWLYDLQLTLNGRSRVHVRTWILFKLAERPVQETGWS